MNEAQKYRSEYRKTEAKKKNILLLFIVIFVVVFIVSLFIGRYNISPLDLLKYFTGDVANDDIKFSVFFLIRLPRLIAVSIVGMALSVSGSVYQNMFRNPLVSPNILGVSAGCCFGASLGILLPFAFPYSIELCAFIFGLIAVILTYNLSRRVKSSPVLMLILGGIIVSSFFNALLAIFKYIADPYSELPSIAYWMMGGFFRSTWDQVIAITIVIIPVLVILLVLTPKLNIMSLGDEDAKILGVNVDRTRKLFILLTTFIVALSVSVSGAISWVGLIVPHISRYLVGADNKISIPLSLFFGAVSLLIADDLARSLSTSEIPIGILISFIGAPIFAYILIKTKSKRGFHEN